MRLIQYDRPMSSTIDHLLRDIKVNWIKKLKLKPGIYVLDAGCGYGQDVNRISYFIGSTGSVFGLDINKTELDSIDSKIRTENGFCAADAQMIPFGQHVFDLIWSDRLLQHVEDPELAIREFKRICKPDGLLMLSDSDHYSA